MTYATLYEDSREACLQADAVIQLNIGRIGDSYWQVVTRDGVIANLPTHEEAVKYCINHELNEEDDYDGND